MGINGTRNTRTDPFFSWHIRGHERSFGQLQTKHPLASGYLERRVPLFRERHFAKHELFCRPGDVVKHTFFVDQGIFRQYYMNEDGKGRKIYFALGR